MLPECSTDVNGYHSLVRTSVAGYEMPPLATVTLEKVEEPGEWEVRGLRRAALYGARDVEVSFVGRVLGRGRCSGIGV